MILLQIIILPVLLFLLVFTITRYRKRQMRLWTFLFGLLIWGSAIAVFSYPNLSTFLAQKIGVGRGTDLIFYIATIVLFYLSFRILIRHEKLERSITSITRQIAIENALKEFDIPKNTLKQRNG